MLLALSCRVLPEVVRLRIRWKRSFGGNTPFQRGLWLLLLRMLAPIRIGMVWPPRILRPERNVRPGFMDGITLARKSGQELRNDYIITESPAFDELRLFFHAAVRELVHAYLDYPRPRIDTSFAFAPTGGSRIYAESLRFTMIAFCVPHGRIQRRISRRQIQCWLCLGYPRLHRQFPSSPLWPTHSHRLIR